MAAGPAVALCSYTTVVGYASLLLSDNRGIRSFGLAALIGELTCLCAALALAPALLDLRRRARGRLAATARERPTTSTLATQSPSGAFPI
jgi:predicted RND superfamily exporter protein